MVISGLHLGKVPSFIIMLKNINLKTVKIQYRLWKKPLPTTGIVNALTRFTPLSDWPITQTNQEAKA